MIVDYSDGRHRAEVLALWRAVFGYETPHNDPALLIDRKVEVDDGLFWVAEDDGAVIGTIMAGYDGPARGEVLVHIGVEKEFRPQKKAHPAFAVDDLDALADRLRAEEFPVQWDETLPGRRRVYTADPFGNRIEFLAAGDGFRDRS